MTHAVLGEMGCRRIMESEIDEVITTDSTPISCPERVTQVSVAGLLGEAIRRIYEGKSVSSLFDIDGPTV